MNTLPKVIAWISESELAHLNLPELRTRPQSTQPSADMVLRALMRWESVYDFAPTTRELAALLGVTYPTVTNAVYRLQEKGLCERHKGARSLRTVKAARYGH